MKYSDWEDMLKMACKGDHFESPHTIKVDDIPKRLMTAFTWNESAEGHDFWSYVNKRLIHIASLRED